MPSASTARCAGSAAPWSRRRRATLCLGLAFMAAAPRNVLPVLDYEKEETAILEAAGSLGLDLVVEESGNPDLLADRLAELRGDAGAAPLLPRRANAGADAAAGRRGGRPARHEARRTRPLDPRPAAAARFRLRLLQRRIRPARRPAGDDARASRRAGCPRLGRLGLRPGSDRLRPDLYKSLVRRLPLEEAVAEARLALLAAGGPKPSRDWHLARLWLGARGGGPLVGGARRRQMLSAEHGHKEFLDKRKQKLPVASRDAFVGRRRELQTALAVLREGQHAGLLIHGMGRLGKSSLAARIAHRRPDLTPVVVFERYDALTIADDLALAVPEAAAAIEGERARLFDAPEALEGLLRRLLEGPCQQKATGKPILLVIDDLERLLDEPTDGAGLWRAKEAHRKVLRAVLRAFAHANTHSRLMLTSRYRFTLPDGADDLAARLHPLQLPPMDEAGARKQALRRLEAEPAAGEAAEEQRSRLAPRAIAAARGSPGLLDLLFDLIEADADEAVRALDDMQRYLDEGTEPSEPKVLAFLQDLLLGRLLELAGPGGEALLRAAMIFALPVPAAAVRSLAAADGGDVERLQALGLLDAYEDLADPASPALAVNPLVRPKLAPSSEEETAAHARDAVEPLFRAWGGEDRTRRPLVCDGELMRLALLAEDARVLAACAIGGMDWLTGQFAFPAAAAWGRRAIGILDDAGLAPPIGLLRRTGEACQTTGDTDAAIGLFDACDDSAAAPGTEVEPFERAALLTRRHACWRAAASSTRRFGSTRRSIAWSGIAARRKTPPSLAVRSPTCCTRAAISTRRCASAGRRSCRSTSGWATCGRRR